MKVNGPVVVDVKLAMLEYGHEFPDLKVEPMDISTYWAESQNRFGEILDLTVPNCEDAACHKHCIMEKLPTWHMKQRDKLSLRIKRILDEYEGESWDDPTHLETFSQVMEDEDLLILMPGMVPAFVLRNRNWGEPISSIFFVLRTDKQLVQLDIRRLTVVQERDDWNKLVLPKNHKRMVQAMVETHSRGSKFTDEKALDKPEIDLVRGKGTFYFIHGWLFL